MKGKCLVRDKINVTIYSVVYAILAYACFVTGAETCTGKLTFNSSYIKSIKISGFPKRFKPISVVDSVGIQKIVDYLELIKLNISLDTRLGYGGGYSIKIQFQNNSVREFSHSGNKYLIEKDKCRYQMAYRDAIGFDGIVVGLLESNFESEDALSLTGTVKTLEEAPNGRTIACSIENKNRELYVVDLRNSSIIDSTGNGWLILRKDDVVRIFYNNDNTSKDDILNAFAVFIKKTNK